MKKLLTQLIVPALLATAPASEADVILPAIFGNNMVIQRDSELTLWGYGKSGEPINIRPSWLEDELQVKPDGDGIWSTLISTPAAGGPHSLHIKGYNEITVENILSGEVWLASGQSNMEWSVNHGIDDGEAEAAVADYPEIRFFSVKHVTAPHPQLDVYGEWVVATPETMRSFSAVAYFFGRELHKKLAVPVGLIDSSWGGTPGEVWTDPARIEADPALAASAAKQRVGPWGPREPGRTFNAMIKPLIPFRIKGVIWYQGESNINTSDTYDDLMEALISGWREHWGYGYPFYFAQIAPWRGYGDFNSAALRDAQRQALRVPQTAMVVTTDIGDVETIHPGNKLDVGKRFANLALKYDYEVLEAEVESPLFREIRILDGAAEIVFAHAGTGLVVRGEKLEEFEIAGEDRIFYPAEAEITGKDTVRVSSAQVPEPVAVRYAWRNLAAPNLFNEEGFPASTFRTDTWEGADKPRENDSYAPKAPQ